jgi:hypothetical protein
LRRLLQVVERYINGIMREAECSGKPPEWEKNLEAGCDWGVIEGAAGSIRLRFGATRRLVPGVVPRARPRSPEGDMEWRKSAPPLAP